MTSAATKLSSYSKGRDRNESNVREYPHKSPKIRVTNSVINNYIVVSNKNGNFFLLKLSYSKK